MGSISFAMRIVLVFAALAAGNLWAGEYAVLTTGFRLHAERHSTDGPVTKLYDRDGGYTAIPTETITGFEEEDYVPPAPTQLPAASQPEQPMAADLHAIVKKAAEEHGVHPALVSSVIAAESAYDPKAISPKGAMGLMQLMPGTAKELGVSNPMDPAQNVSGGAAYLKQLLDRYAGFTNQFERAVAAYNAGPAKVDAHGGLPPYRETVDFVSRVARKITR